MIVRSDGEVSEKTLNQLVDVAVRTVGFRFDLGIMYDILTHAIRKWELSGKGQDYLPILVENELRDYLMREIINEVGRLNHEKQLDTREAVGAGRAEGN